MSIISERQYKMRMSDFYRRQSKRMAVLTELEQASSIALFLSCDNMEYWQKVQKDVCAWKSENASQRTVFCYISQKKPKDISLGQEVNFIFKTGNIWGNRFSKECVESLQSKTYSVMIDTDEKPKTDSLLLKSMLNASLRIGRNAQYIDNYDIVIQVNKAVSPTAFLTEVESYLHQLV
ncbi:MAG: hypothetical protein J5701_04370 [Bacteroidales bacterium]|nr:hypothetical protein [Bacteroidales bacterium]